MERRDLAARLVAADDAGRAALLEDHAPLADARLAYALKDICLAVWSDKPARTVEVAAALQSLERIVSDPEITALRAWVEGFAAVVQGEHERAVSILAESETRFSSLGKPHIAAATQVIRLYALALLGRYDEAIECGLRAREVLVAHHDIEAAGKIEHNIGNIFLRRDRYDEAEKFQKLARERFAALGDIRELAKIDNNLALIYSSQHKFRLAEQLYNQALTNAEAAGLSVTQAGIEASMGTLALFQGHYDLALNLLERSRRRFASLGMPHQSAVAELELADAYLDLNMANEAANVYDRIIPLFAALGMQGEQARALAQHARASILRQRAEEAHSLLGEARKLYIAEGNSVGEAMVTLTEAQLHYADHSYGAANLAARDAESLLAAMSAWRHALLARWLRGETARQRGHFDEAKSLFESTLKDAELHSQPQIAQRCHTSFGLLAAAAGDRAGAEAAFKRAIALIERLRAPLPAEEFRTAFFADKLVPYYELVRLFLNECDDQKTIEALSYVERARSRALIDMIGGSIQFNVQPRDPFETELVKRVDELREELNWFYTRLSRPSFTASASSETDITALEKEVRERENETMEITRQLQHSRASIWTQVQVLDIARLQTALGTDTALVQFTTVDDELIAFVVSDESVKVVRQLGSQNSVDELLRQFRFQIDAFKFGAQSIRRHLDILTLRTRQHLQQLYDILLRPLEDLTSGKRLAIVAHRSLYYVPFHALHDGEAYVIERREVCYAPSAVVLLHCLEEPAHAMDHAVLVGVTDEQTPRVADEIEALEPLFPRSTVLLNENASLAALKKLAPTADVLHLACHGQFRQENAGFSALRLGDSWLKLHDIYDLNLNCELVTLSACETGINEVVPGDELIGLTRGFLSAGAPSLLLSLWTVDDEATAQLMTSFYTRLLEGLSPAAAIRAAQLELMQIHSHPFFWSPFMLVGRW